MNINHKLYLIIIIFILNIKINTPIRKQNYSLKRNGFILIEGMEQKIKIKL